MKEMEMTENRKTERKEEGMEPLPPLQVSPSGSVGYKSRHKIR